MKKPFIAILIALLVTACVGASIFAIGGAALVNKNGVPASNSAAQASDVAAVNSSQQTDQLAQLQGLVSQYQDHEQQYQEREQQLQQQLDQANTQIQQDQQTLQQVQMLLSFITPLNVETALLLIQRQSIFVIQAHNTWTELQIPHGRFILPLLQRWRSKHILWS